MKMKPHKAGFEDEEDCVGCYDPREEVMERRGCLSCRTFPYRVSDSSLMTGRQCYEAWKSEDDARSKMERDAKTPEEKIAHEALLKGLRELY